MKFSVEKQIDYKIEELTKENRDFVLEHAFDNAKLDLIDNFIEDKNAIGYFVRTEDDLIGYIQGYMLTRFQHAPMLYIHDMKVMKKYRHLGIGTILMDAMKSHAKKHKLSKIFLITNKSNKRAVGLFKKENGKRPHKDDMVFVWMKEDL